MFQRRAAPCSGIQYAVPQPTGPPGWQCLKHAGATSVCFLGTHWAVLLQCQRITVACLQANVGIRPSSLEALLSIFLESARAPTL